MFKNDVYLMLAGFAIAAVSLFFQRPYQDIGLFVGVFTMIGVPINRWQNGFH
jgi:hypothetical protein